MDPSKEIAELREETSQILNRLDALENKLGESHHHERTETTSTGTDALGLVLVIFGGLISLSVIGAIIGIPLLIIGIIRLTKKTSSPTTHTSHSRAHTETKQVTKRHKALEEKIGTGWLGIIGIAALVIGIAFFIFTENNGMSYWAKVSVGILFGLGVIFFGDWFSKKKNYELWGQILTGGGFAIVFFSIYSAHFLYNALSSGITDTILLLITALSATTYSIKRNARIVAAESFLLAYLAAFLAPTSTVITLVYALIISLAAIYVHVRKDWIGYNFFIIPATYTLYLFWRTQNSDFTLATIFLTLYFVLFNIDIWKVMKKKEVLVVSNIVNSLLYYLFMTELLKVYYPEFVSWFALILAAVHVVIYTIINHKIKGSNVYLAVFYFVLFLLYEINKEFSTLFITLLLILLAIAGRRYSSKDLIFASRGLALFVLIKAITYDLIVLDKFQVNDFSIGFVSMILAILALYMMPKVDAELAKGYRFGASILLLIGIYYHFGQYPALVTALYALIAIIWSNFKGKDLEFHALGFAAIASLKAFAFDSFILKQVYSNVAFTKTYLLSFIPTIIACYIVAAKTKNKVFAWFGSILTIWYVLLEFDGFAVSGLWALFGLILLFTGFKTKIRDLRLQGIIIFIITIVKVFAYDTLGLEPVYRTISFIVLGIILIIASFLYAQNKEKIKEMI